MGEGESRRPGAWRTTLHILISSVSGSQQASVQDVSDFLLQHNKLFSFVSELMDKKEKKNYVGRGNSFYIN
eukprot:7985-Pelagomonas_calceolata.AAC.1